MMRKPRQFYAFHTSNIESFGTRFKRSNTPEYISLKPNKVHRTNISRTSLHSLNDRESQKFERIQRVSKSRLDVMWKYPIFGPNFANQSHTYKMMRKPRQFDAFHTSNIESFGTRFKHSNTPEYISLKPNKVYRANLSRTSLLWLTESWSL
jgi:hypothetical protein